MPSFIRTTSSKATRKAGERLGELLRKESPGRQARVYALSGELGAGKTTFLKGFLRGIGAKGRGQSPTFVLMRRHGLGAGGFKNLWHIDAYRLKNARELRALGWQEILNNPANICAIEWPERVQAILPKNTKKIRFVHGRKPNERMIQIPKTD